MAIEIRLPKLGNNMTAGTIVNYSVQENTRVEVGQVLYEVETDKATMEIESPVDGMVLKILVDAGKSVAVDAPVMLIGAPGEAVDRACLDRLIAEIASAGDDSEQSGPSDGVAERAGITSIKDPYVAQKLRLLEADERIQKQSEKPQSQEYKLGTRVPLTRLQQVVAEKLLWSKQNIPCFYLNLSVDATDLVETRARFNEENGVKVSYNDFIVKAVALGIQEYPVMAGQLSGDCIALADTIDIALAISVEDGLVAPVIRDCGAKTLLQISAAAEELISKARKNTLEPDDLHGGCVSVSNLGGFGIDSFIPIVVPGQASVIGVGAIKNRYVAVGRKTEVRKMMEMTISVDHKVVNGAEAAQFFDFVKKQLENAESLTC